VGLVVDMVLYWEAAIIGDFFIVLLNNNAVELLLIHVYKKDPNPREH
jgi:hypothetical protein